MNIPIIDTRVSDYGFDIFYLTPTGQLLIKGDFGPKITASFSYDFLVKTGEPLDSLLPFIVAYDADVGTISIEVPSGENFFEQDFYNLNKVMFNKNTSNFIFE